MSADRFDVLRRLSETVAARRGADPETSHTARLLSGGPARCAQKFGEEAVETVIAGSTGDRAELISESADALFHLIVLLTACDASLDDTLEELARREGVSGVAEKAARSKG